MNAINKELWQDSLYSVPARVQAFYDSCNFSEIGDRQYNDLAASLGDIGGFDGLITDSFLSVLSTLHDALESDSKQISTKFGLRILVKGAQDMIALHARILSDLLVLVVFADMEVDREEFPMDDFNSTQVFQAIISQLRQVQLAKWLATNTRLDPALHATTNDAPNPDSAVITSYHTSTVLENLFARNIAPQSSRRQTQSTALTHSIRDILTFVAGGEEGHQSLPLDNVLTHILSDLLKHSNYDIAVSFLPFQPSNSWSIYLQGRLYLLQGDYNEACIYFKKAAFKLCKPLPSTISALRQLLINCTSSSYASIAHL